MGSPPTCRPECVLSTDCPQHQACIKQKCRDPCPGTCGINARCQVINHNPICTCKAGFTGDPFVTCQLEQSKNTTKIIKTTQLKLFIFFDPPLNICYFTLYLFNFSISLFSLILFIILFITFVYHTCHIFYVFYILFF